MGRVAIRNVTERTYEAGTMHDIEVQFPYGMTDDDLAKLAAVEGVTDVEPGYTSFATMLDGATRYVLKLQSLTERIDLPTVVEGRLPNAANEVALLSFWAEEHGFAVGDTVTLKHDNTDKDDADGMANLASDSFVITGLVEHPAYLSKVAGSLGVASIGSGNVDCVGFVTTDGFDADSFEEGYPNAYLRCDSLRGMNTFTDEYKNTINPIVDRVGELGGTLGSARYQDLHDDAQSKIDEAQDKIDDAEKKLADAEDEITDGEQEIPRLGGILHAA